MFHLFNINCKYKHFTLFRTKKVRICLHLKTNCIYLPTNNNKSYSNENNDGTYKLVALLTTPTVVREQRSCIYTIRKILLRALSHLRQGSFYLPGS